MQYRFKVIVSIIDLIDLNRFVCIVSANLDEFDELGFASGASDSCVFCDANASPKLPTLTFFSNRPQFLFSLFVDERIEEIEVLKTTQ